MRRPAPYGGVVLHGRDRETERLVAMLDAARSGHASSLLISGGAGVGKSALLETMAAQAHGATVLGTAGLESESPLAFAALHRLLRPVIDRVASLPEQQERALHLAFGEDHGDRIDPFLIALSTLSLLTEVAESGPVLCLVDDAQWLDVASSEALLFAARRLLAEPVVMVFTAREDDPSVFAPTDVPRMLLQGLSDEAVGALLRERSDDELSDQVVRKLAARTGGNPLALVELPGRLSAAQLEGTASLPDELPLSDRVERVFLDRCRRLSEPGQTLMLLASADDTGRLSVLLQAGEALGVPSATVLEVEQTELLSMDGDSVRVRHPLVRSAVYQAATGSERRRAHAAMADALTETGDRDRQTWHRAAACDGPDEGVAAELEAAGSRAERRGGYDSASEAYHRAARLTSRDELRARRLFSAARTAYAAGTIDRAGTLLDEVRLIADDPLLRADIDRLRGRLQVVLGSAVDAHRIFIRAARGVAETDQERAVEMAALAGVLRSHGADSGTTLPIGVVTANVTATDSVRLQCLKLLIQSTTRDAERNWGAALDVLRTALAVGLDTEDRDVWANLANTALHLGDDAAHRRYFNAMLSAARSDGAVMEVLYALHRICLSELAAGDWPAVHRSAHDALSLARSIGQPALTATPLAWLTLLAALEGADDYDSLLKRTEDARAQHRLGIMERPIADLLHWAKGTRAQNAGAVSESFHHLDQMRVPVLTRLATSARITAAVQAQEHSHASDWTSEIEAFAAATALPWALAVAEHGRALLADTNEAPGLYERALNHHAQAGRALRGGVHPAGVRGAPAASGTPGRGPRAPQQGARDVPRPARRTSRGPGHPRAARLR